MTGDTSPSEVTEELLDRAKMLRRRINELRIDHPEAADARRNQLAQLEAEIAARSLASRRAE